MEYTFRLHAYEETARDQLLRALERVTEARSRKACPGLWKMTDRLNQVQRMPPEVPGAPLLRRRTLQALANFEERNHRDGHPERRAYLLQEQSLLA